MYTKSCPKLRAEGGEGVNWAMPRRKGVFFWDSFPSKPRLYGDFSLIKRRRKKKTGNAQLVADGRRHCFRSVHHMICLIECFIEADGSLTKRYLDGVLTTCLVFKFFAEQVWAFFQRWSLMVNLVVEDFSFAGKPFLLKQTFKMAKVEGLS